MAPGRQHRVVIERGDRSASVFLTRAQVEDAIDLIIEVRKRSYAEE